MAAYFLDFLKVQGRSGHHGIEWEEERGQEPSSDTFPKAAGSKYIYILLCPSPGCLRVTLVTGVLPGLTEFGNSLGSLESRETGENITIHVG